MSLFGNRKSSPQPSDYSFSQGCSKIRIDPAKGNQNGHRFRTVSVNRNVKSLFLKNKEHVLELSGSGFQRNKRKHIFIQHKIKIWVLLPQDNVVMKNKKGIRKNIRPKIRPDGPLS